MVGAGTAGCVLANRLSADARNRVLLLEAGGSDNYPGSTFPSATSTRMGNPRTDWCFKTEPEPGLNGRALSYPRGKVLGGCSAINGMIYMRGQAADYDHWRQLGNAGWAWDDVLPCSSGRRTTGRARTNSTVPAANGGSSATAVVGDPRRLPRAPPSNAASRKTDDFNRGDNEGCGYFQVNQRRGIRWTTAKAFLRPAAIAAEPDGADRCRRPSTCCSTAPAAPA